LKRDVLVKLQRPAHHTIGDVEDLRSQSLQSSQVQNTQPSQPNSWLIPRCLLRLLAKEW